MDTSAARRQCIGKRAVVARHEIPLATGQRAAAALAARDITRGYVEKSTSASPMQVQPFGNRRCRRFIGECRFEAAKSRFGRGPKSVEERHFVK